MLSVDSVVELEGAASLEVVVVVVATDEVVQAWDELTVEGVVVVVVGVSVVGSASEVVQGARDIEAVVVVVWLLLTHEVSWWGW